jgi:hypothetical protein
MSKKLDLGLVPTDFSGLSLSRINHQTQGRVVGSELISEIKNFKPRSVNARKAALQW